MQKVRMTKEQEILCEKLNDCPTQDMQTLLFPLLARVESELDALCYSNHEQLTANQSIEVVTLCRLRDNLQGAISASSSLEVIYEYATQQ